MGDEGCIQSRVREALKLGKVQHVMQDGRVDGRDLLQSGQVSVEEVMEFFKPCRSLEYEETPHPFLPEIKAMIFRTNISEGGLPVSWYVKCYCLSNGSDEIWYVGVFSTLEGKGP